MPIKRIIAFDFDDTLAQTVSTIGIRRILDDGNSIALDPMNASDRKVVHDAVSDVEGVSTRSEGSDYDRHVVIVVDEM